MMNSNNFITNENFIDLFLQKLNDKNNTDICDIFKFYKNEGLFKFFEAYEKSKYKNKVLKNINFTFSNKNLFTYIKKEFIVFTLLHEYQILTGKNKLDAINDLYSPDLMNEIYLFDIKNNTNFYIEENSKILESIKNNQRYYHENIQLINQLSTIINNIMLVTINDNNQYNIVNKFSGIKSNLLNIDLNENDSQYFHVIKNKLEYFLNQEHIDDYEIQYLIIVMSFLEQFKNVDFYLIYNDFINPNIISVLDGNIENFNISLIKNNDFYILNNKINEFLKIKTNNLILELNELIIDSTKSHEEQINNDINIHIFKDILFQYVDEIYSLNKFIHNNNINYWYELINNEIINNEFIQIKKIINYINILPAIYNCNFYIMKRFEEFEGIDIFNYKNNSFNNTFLYDFHNLNKIDLNNNKETKDKKTMALEYFKDEILDTFDNDMLNDFIDDCKNILMNTNKQLNESINNYDKDKYIHLKRSFSTLKENCLIIGLNNLSEPYYLLDLLLDNKNKLSQPINRNEKELIDLININFLEMLKSISNGNLEISTPVKEILNRLNSIDENNYDLSSNFYKINNQNKEMPEKNKEPDDNDLDYFLENQNNDFNEVDNSDDLVNQILQNEASNLDVDDNIDDIANLLNLASESIDEKQNILLTQSVKTENTSDTSSIDIDDIFDTDDLNEPINTDYFVSQYVESPNQDIDDINVTDTLKTQTNEIQIENSNEASDLSENDNFIEDEHIDNNLTANDEQLNSFYLSQSVELNSNSVEIENNLLEDVIMSDSQNDDYLGENEQEDMKKEIEQHIESTKYKNETNVNSQSSNTNQKIEQQYNQSHLSINTSHAIPSNKVIVFDNDRQGFIINSLQLISSQDWAVINSNTQHNCKNIWDYNLELQDKFKQGYDELIIDEGLILPFIDNMIEDMEVIGLYKTSSMLIKFRFFINYYVTHTIPYNSEMNDVITKVLNSVYSLIVENQSSSNHEQFDHIIAYIDTYHKLFESKLIHLWLNKYINDGFGNIENKINQDLKHVYDILGQSKDSFYNYEQSFSKFTLQMNSALNKQINNSDNIIEKVNDINVAMASANSQTNKSFETLNSNLKSVYNAIKKDSEDSQIGGKKNKWW